MITSSIGSSCRRRGQVGDVAEVAQAVVAALVEREEADRLIAGDGALAQGRGDVVDAVRGADEYRAAAVADAVEDPAAGDVEEVAQAAHIDGGEDQAAEEDPVGVELAAGDQGEDQADDGRLEEGRDRPREAGPHVACAIEADAGEEQDGDQRREGEELERGAGNLGGVVAVGDERLDDERRKDRGEDPEDVDRQQRQPAGGGAVEVAAREQVEQVRRPGADVARVDLALLKGGVLGGRRELPVGGCGRVEIPVGSGSPSSCDIGHCVGQSASLHS